MAKTKQKTEVKLEMPEIGTKRVSVKVTSRKYKVVPHFKGICKNC